MTGPLQQTIRFLLEVAALVAAAITGATLGSPPFGLPGAVVLVALFVTVWGLWLAPRARFPQTPAFRLLVGTAVMETAAIGLAIVGPATAGVALAAAILVNAIGLAATGATAEPPAAEGTRR